MEKRLFEYGTLAVTVIVLMLSGLQPSKAVAQDAEVDAMEALKLSSRQSIEWWNSEFQINAGDLFAPGYINHQEPIAATNNEQGVTLSKLASIIASFHEAFPDTKVEFQMQIAAGNRVVTHWTFTGTQKGIYEGLAPTNKTVSWSGVSIDEYNEAGQMSETWVVWDKFTLFSTLGLISTR